MKTKKLLTCLTCICILFSCIELPFKAYAIEPEINQIIFKSPEETEFFILPFDEQITEYELPVLTGMSEILIHKLPILPYATFNLKEGQKLSCENNGKISLEITNSSGNKKNYSFTVKHDLLAMAKSVTNSINALPILLQINSDTINQVLQQVEWSEILYRDLDFAYEKSYVDKNTNNHLSTVLENLAQLGLKEITDLDQKIKNSINHEKNPVTLNQGLNISKLMKDYNAIPQSNRKYLQYKNDLLIADEIIKGLKNGFVSDKVFSAIMGQDVNYTVSGTVKDTNSYAYSMKINGKSIRAPATLKIGLSFQCENETRINRIAKNPVAYFSFAEKSNLSGVMEVEIQTKLKDSNYKLFYYDENKQIAQFVKIINIVNGFFSFETNIGGDYFVASELINGGRLSILSEAEIKNETYIGKIPKSAFTQIKGRALNVKGIGQIDRKSDKTCTFTFHGKDVYNPIDFYTDITHSSRNQPEIKKLSPYAIIVAFTHNGELPGEALLELSIDLKSGEYLLFTYNEEKKQAEYVEKIDIKNGKTKFIVCKNVEYFIAKCSNMDSLLSSIIDNVANKESLETQACTVKPIKSDLSQERQEKIKNEIKKEMGENKMDARLFTADDVLILLNTLMGEDGLTKYLLPGAIFLGCAFIGICILISGGKKSRECTRVYSKKPIKKIDKNSISNNNLPKSKEAVSPESEQVIDEINNESNEVEINA